MTTNPLLSARIAPEFIARIDACVAALNAAAEPGARPTERGDVVRLLLARALPGLEAELGIATTKGAKGQKGGKKPPRKA